MSVGLGIAVMTVMGVLMGVFAPELMELMSPVETIVSEGAQALRIDELSKADLTAKMQKKTGLENPNSVLQMKDYLNENGMEVESLGKKEVAAMIKTAPEALAEAGFLVDRGLDYCQGNRELYLSLLRQFEQDRGEKRARLDRCFEAGDLANYAVAVPALKSTAKLIGNSPYSPVKFVAFLLFLGVNHD